MDNIGKITECFYAFEHDVKNCAVLSRGMLIEFQNGSSWKKLPATQGRIEVDISPAGDGLGTYEVDISVAIPDFKLDEDEIFRLNNEYILFKFRTGNGKNFVAGDKENFLTAVTKRLTPSAASGYAGMQINISGVQAHPEIPLL